MADDDTSREASRPASVRPDSYPSWVSRETRGRLTVYAQLVQRWNSRINLVSGLSAGQFASRHLLDCLQLIPLMPANIERAADIGSGAGLPGLVLAIATATPFLLIEADLRKAAFLREAVRQTGAPARVLARRAESVRETVDLVTARAVAPMSALLAWSFSLLRPGGTCLLLKGSGLAAELRQAETRWSIQVEVWPSTTAQGSSIVSIRDLRPR